MRRGWNIWIGLSIFATGALVSGLLAAGWFAYGGFPHDYDRHGVVSIPGAAVVELPEGRIMLDHADEMSPCNSDTSSLKDLPQGTSVRITAVDGGDDLEIDELPAWLYDFSTNCRGHEPFGRIDVPEDGSYLVEITDAAHGPLPARPPVEDLPAGGADSTSGPGISFGPAPWTPLGSPLLGAVLVFLLGTALSSSSLLIPMLVRRLKQSVPR